MIRAILYRLMVVRMIALATVVRCQWIEVVMLAGLAFLPSASGMTEAERREYAEKLLKILPDAPQFKQWLDKTGELPPDFDALPRVNGLPDPLKFLDGRPVRNAAEWRARRQEIAQLYQKYDLGTFP